MNPWVSLFRPGDWVKNVFVLLPMLFWFSGQGRDTSHEVLHDKLIALLLAFIAFCVTASGTYAVNDAHDAAEDRKHPVKRSRPVASGAIGEGTATTVGVLLMIAGTLLGWWINTSTGMIMLSYVVLQLIYNVRFKVTPFVDVAIVATGFCLRAAVGATSIQVKISIWLILCVFFLTLFLGFTKRLCDKASAENAVRQGEIVEWKSRAGYDSRDELNWLLALSAGLVLVTYLMYTLSEHANGLYGSRALGLSLLTPFVAISIHRFYRRANLGLSDKPLETLTEDRVLLAAIGLYFVGALLVLYYPPVERILGEMLVR
ncbi:MAG: UbiA prenyltransferase family protein [Planctomycetes bacterium]|nr:UbiA prenyltransferase family protein [Planctomycetota bacterium]